jgi:hypothetical protein
MRYVVSAKYVCRMCGSAFHTRYSEPVEEQDLPRLLLPPTRPPERWEVNPLPQQVIHKCLLAHEGAEPRRGVADLQGGSLRDADWSPSSSNDEKQP